MADVTKVIEGVVTGLLTGGTSALTTFLAVFKDIKKRITALENAVGQTDPKTGLHLALSYVEDTTKRLRREMDSWEDDPPQWAMRLLARARSNSSTDLSGQVQFEEHINRTVKIISDRLKRVEDRFEEEIETLKRDSERRISTHVADDLHLTRDEYIQDSRQRAAEIAKLREQLATANGLLRGVMTTLGYIDADKPPSKPKPPFGR